MMVNNTIIISGIVAFFLIEKLVSNCMGKEHSHEHGTQKKKNNAKKEDKEKEARYKSYVVLNLIGDFLHNFTDGLSIGVAYIANYKMGIVTTMAMFFHEIPHEVGDFAVLFQLKYNICKILGFQILTAVGAMIGTYLGTVIGQVYLP